MARTTGWNNISAPNNGAALATFDRAIDRAVKSIGDYSQSYQDKQQAQRLAETRGLIADAYGANPRDIEQTAYNLVRSAGLNADNQAAIVNETRLLNDSFQRNQPKYSSVLGPDNQMYVINPQDGLLTPTGVQGMTEEQKLQQQLQNDLAVARLEAAGKAASNKPVSFDEADSILAGYVEQLGDGKVTPAIVAAAKNQLIEAGYSSANANNAIKANEILNPPKPTKKPTSKSKSKTQKGEDSNTADTSGDHIPVEDALQKLKENPNEETKKYFKDSFGYLPEGYELETK